MISTLYTIGRVALIIAVALLCCHCDRFTESDMPLTELNTPAVFEERNTADAAVSDIYAKIRENGMLSGKGNGMSKELGLYTDELRWYGGLSTSSDEYYNNTLLPSLTDIGSWWNNCYSQVYAANAVIEGIEKSTKLSEADCNQFKGEALFLRGLLHFYALQLWGDIPYVTTTNYTVNQKVERLPATEVYQLIINDLETAATLLSPDYITGERVRANSFAARALLARVYLYNHQWAEAAENASAVINNSDVYVMESDLGDVFLTGSTSAILQIGARSSGSNTYEGTTFIFNSGPPPAVALRQDFVDSFEEGDQRKIKWIRKITNGANSWYHAYKYKKTASSSPQLEYQVLLRLSEQYLIRAEARAQQNDIVGAAQDLDVVRMKAGLPGTTANTQNSILIAIMRERRSEFFTEFGHRFFDLKRSFTADEVLSAVKPGWNHEDQLLPIPEKELLLNTHLGNQNPGY